ncbi:MAG TPA: twin-arginine translocase TatA/TatE family subunit [Acidimicrobiia bacterium]|nr:twin-arginine translocase TatA/TatE family subunit [Acidimicrobiia bacterium]
MRAQELLIVLLIVLLIFGARKLPDLARSLGASAKEFRKGVSEGSEDTTEVQASEVPAEDKPAPETTAPDAQKPD